jgi:hypothetical protein
VFTINDLEEETAKLTEKGVSIACSGSPQDSGAFAYFDTRERGGDIMIRLVQAR